MSQPNNQVIRENYYWTLEYDVSNSFNRLKAKIYNLIEASIPDKTQQAALKGLVKGFANDEYGVCIDNMRYDAKQAKYLTEEDDFLPRSAEPLETILP